MTRRRAPGGIDIDIERIVLDGRERIRVRRGGFLVDYCSSLSELENCSRGADSRTRT